MGPAEVGVDAGVGVAVAAGGGVAVEAGGVGPPEPIVRVVVAMRTPVRDLAEMRPVPSVVVAGIGNITLNAPDESAAKVASRQPLMVRFPACPAANPLPETAICVAGAA